MNFFSEHVKSMKISTRIETIILIVSETECLAT